jgi:1-acyl-sn-glycerol-3-phosphate acyltransferase
VTLLVIPLVVLYTLLLGIPGMILCLLIPGGALLMPLARAWSWLVMTTARVRWKVTFDPAFVAGHAAVYAANHQSQFDIPALVLAMPVDFRVVAKRSLLYVPVFGWALWLAGFIFIDRSNREQAIRSLDRAASRLRRGTSMAIFAEGTRSPDGTLLPFKRGGFVLAIQAGAPVVPVTISGGRDVMPKGTLWIRPGTLAVHFGAPIPTLGYSYDTRDALIARVRGVIAEQLARS